MDARKHASLKCSDVSFVARVFCALEFDWRLSHIRTLCALLSSTWQRLCRAKGGHAASRHFHLHGCAPICGRLRFALRCDRRAHAGTANSVPQVRPEQPVQRCVPRRSRAVLRQLAQQWRDAAVLLPCRRRPLQHQARCVRMQARDQEEAIDRCLRCDCRWCRCRCGRQHLLLSQAAGDGSRWYPSSQRPKSPSHQHTNPPTQTRMPAPAGWSKIYYFIRLSTT